MKILFHYEVGERLDQQLRSMMNKDVELVYCRQDDTARFAEEIQTADVLWHVLKPVEKSHIESARRLKLIQKIGVGVNTIDLNAAKKAGVAVCNMPGTNSRAVAEMTLSLMLSALRLQPRLDATCRSGQWHLDQATAESFREVGNKTVGLVGFGGVAQILAPILTAMEATVIYTSQTPKGVPYPFFQLDELLAAADIVSLHLPLTAKTENMFDAERISRIKKGAVFVNTARGGLVVESALHEALRTGHLHAAGLDVFASEPATASNPLFELDNVVPAPHVSWLTVETWQRSLEVALENTESVRDGKPLLHRVV